MRSIRDKIFETQCLFMDFFKNIIEFFADSIDFIMRMTRDSDFFIEIIYVNMIEKSEELIEFFEGCFDKKMRKYIRKCSEEEHQINTNQN